MKTSPIAATLIVLACITTSVAAQTRLFSASKLASGNPVSDSGFSITTSQSGGSIEFITSGIYTGLHLGGSNTSGTYTFTFSEPVISVEIEFDALSASENYPAESIDGFSTSNGSASIDFVPQGGTSFNGSVIMATDLDGQGVIRHQSSQPFSSFTFHHSQPSMTSGFVVERFQVELLGSEAIGGAGAVSGSPAITRHGVTSVLMSGDPIHPGDIVETEDGESVNLLFSDESSILVGENARLEIDEYVYDPESGENSQKVSLLRGLFLFTSGLIGQTNHDDVSIKTPYGFLGIRGTAFYTEIIEVGSLIEVTVTVTSGLVVFDNWWTGESKEVPAGESLHVVAPAPSLQTIKGRLIMGAERLLKLSGYTDQPFTVQRSTGLDNWENWMTLQPSDLPIELDISLDPMPATQFFRLSR